MAATQDGKPVYQGRNSPVVQRMLAGKAASDKAAEDARLKAVLDEFWRALPQEKRQRDEFLDRKADDFAPLHEQLHRMLDLALGLQERASTAMDMKVWRLLGEILLRQAFGGLQDFALWQAEIRPDDVSAMAARRHLLSLLRCTPHLIPGEQRAALALDLVRLERDAAPSPLLERAGGKARKLALDDARLEIVRVIEANATSSERRRDLLKDAEKKTGCNAKQISKWTTEFRKSEPHAMQLAAAAAASSPTEPPSRRQKPIPPHVVRELDQAVQAWRRAGGKCRAKRGST